MQNLSKTQAVKLFKKNRKGESDLYILPNYHFTALNFEISFISMLHFHCSRHIICPILPQISRKDDGYDPLFLHDNRTAGA